MNRRKRYHHRNLRDVLLRSVGRIIKKHGTSFVSLREVARDAGVSHSAPAHHFANKAGMLTAFAVCGFERLVDGSKEEVAKAGDAPSKLEGLGRAYVRFALRNPEHFSVMFRSELLDVDSPEFVQAADRAHAMLAAVIGHCVDEGFLSERDVEAVGAAAWGLVHGLAALWIGGRLCVRVKSRDGEEIAARAIKAFVDGTVRSTRV